MFYALKSCQLLCFQCFFSIEKPFSMLPSLFCGTPLLLKKCQRRSPIFDAKVFPASFLCWLPKPAFTWFQGPPSIAIRRSFPVDSPRPHPPRAVATGGGLSARVHRSGRGVQGPPHRRRGAAEGARREAGRGRPGEGGRGQSPLGCGCAAVLPGRWEADTWMALQQCSGTVKQTGF